MKLVQRTTSCKVSPRHARRLSYTRFKGKVTGFKIIRALLSLFSPGPAVRTMLLNFKSRPETDFGPGINNGSPVNRQRDRTWATPTRPAVLWGHFEFLFMFKVSQPQTQNQSQRNTEEDGIIIAAFTTQWEICEFLTNWSFKIIFLTVVLQWKETFQN